MNKTRHEKGNFTTDTTEIQKIIRDFHKQLYANKMDNRKEMDKFLASHKLPRLNQEEIENINRPITSTESPNKQVPDGYTGEFYQTFREGLTPILLKRFHKLQRKENSQTHFTRPPSPLYQNQTKVLQKKKKKKIIGQISLMNIDTKILNKILAI